MSDASTSDAKKPMEQPNNGLSKAMGQLSVISNKISKAPKSLSDMPIDVVAFIIERSGYKEQLKLRKVCKSLREIVDKQKPSCKFLQVHSVKGDIICYYNNKRVYSRKYKRILAWDPIEGVSKDYRNMHALDDLAFTLKTPKLQLESFSASFDNFPGYWSHYSVVRDSLDSMGHQLSARNCKIEITCPSEYRSILPYLKTGVLEKITVRYINCRDVWGDGESLDTLKEVALLDQWKQAKELEFMNEYDKTFMLFAKHFERFHFHEYLVDNWLLIDIRDFLSTLSNFTFCLIEPLLPPYAQHLRSKVGDPAAPNDRTEYVSHYSIPNSDHYLEFMFFEKSVEIRKIEKS